MGNTNIYCHFKTRLQIAQEYGISTRTLSRWVMKANIHLPSRLLGPKEQLLIYEEFGYPNQTIPSN